MPNPRYRRQQLSHFVHCELAFGLNAVEECFHRKFHLQTCVIRRDRHHRHRVSHIGDQVAEPILRLPTRTALSAQAVKAQSELPRYGSVHKDALHFRDAIFVGRSNSGK